MKLAYLMNAYPMTSTTFIRREIEAHEQAGYEVQRYAIRPWDQELVDPNDIKEQRITYYLLMQGIRVLFFSFFRELVENPSGLAKAVHTTFRMMRVANGKRVKQFAYLLEAILLKQKTVEDGTEHIHTHFSTNSASVALLSHTLGGPSYSMTVHGPDELFEMTENSLAAKVKNATFVATISQYCQRIVDTHTCRDFSEKIYVVRCGLDVSDFGTVMEVPESNQLVCVGRLCKAKAQVLLIEAFAEVIKHNPGARLVLIGDGEERPAVEEKISSLSMQEYVVLHGWAKNDEVREAILHSRALVLPSLAEGLPIVIMESFALGRPVVTTDICGIPELVDASCGWLAQPGDRISLVNSMVDVLSKQPYELSLLAQEGRRRVLDLHNQHLNSKQLRELIQNN